MAQLFANNATTKLAASINSSATTLTVTAGTGALFPTPTGGNYFLLTLAAVTAGTETSWEIIKVTARSTDTLTVIRAQESTAAASWAVDTKVEARLTAGSFGGLSTTQTYSLTSFTATAGQTTFTLNYTIGLAQVFLNGVLLNSVDYTATNGTSIVLAEAAAVNDIVDVVVFNILNIGQVSQNGVLGGTNGQLLTSNGTNSYWAAAPVTLPSQTGNTGKYLTTNGTAASWGILPSSLPITTFSGSVTSVSVANGYVPVLQADGVTTTNVTVS